MPNKNPKADLSTSAEHPLDARELDVFVRLWDPSCEQYLVVDRATNWFARFPTASRADEEMLKRFYKKQASVLLTYSINQIRKGPRT